MKDVSKDIPGRRPDTVVTSQSHVKTMMMRASHAVCSGCFNTSAGQVGLWRGTIDSTSIRRERRRQYAKYIVPWC